MKPPQGPGHPAQGLLHAKGRTAPALPTSAHAPAPQRADRKGNEGMTRTAVYDGRHGWCDERPAGGAYLHVHYAVQDGSYIDWYPTIEEARAALGELGTVINDHVDLTPGEGYVESEAWVSESPEFGLAQ